MRSRPLVSNAVTRAEVDILVPFFGCYQRLYDLCKSVWYHTKSNRYHLYLIDDCSPNKTYIPAYKNAPHTVIVQNEQQLGFGAALKRGFDAGKSEWVVFMHSDCKIETPHWLSELLTIFFKIPNVAMVSPLTDNPGVDNPHLIGKKQEIRGNYILEKGYLPLYCGLSRRDIYEQIGGFIKPYPFRYYEDEELAYRMRAYGIKQVVSGTSWIHHVGAGTTGPLLRAQENRLYDGPDYRKIIESNREKCIADLRALQIVGVNRNLELPNTKKTV